MIMKVLCFLGKFEDEQELLQNSTSAINFSKYKIF